MTDRAYARISLDYERSGSIDKQKASLTRFGGSDVEFYVDKSVSGSKIGFADRPGGKRLLADLVAGDRVLVTKIDRAARNVRDLLDLVETIDARKASIVFVDQNIDTSGPFGKFILVLLAAIAELEANIIGERRKESLAAFALEGRHAVGAAPFGFRSVENPSGRGLVIRPDWEPSDDLEGRAPAEVLREAIDRVLAGESQNAARLPTGLSAPGFSVLLRNPRLVGMVPDGEGVVMIDGVPRVDKDAALLSMSEWTRLREHMKRPDHRPWARQDGYGAALSCSECGDRLYKSVSKQKAEYSTYKCGRRKHEKGSASASVVVHEADQYLENTFLDEFGHEPVVVVVATSSEDLRLEAVSLAQVRIDEAQRRFLGAETDADADEALEAQRTARKALQEAQALPSETEYKAEYTGKTVAERWASASDGERCRMLQRVGRWVAHPGRKKVSIDKKITLERDDLLVELLHRAVGEADNAPKGFLMTD